MWHVRKQATKKEIAEYEEWKRKHEEESKKRLAKIATKVKEKPKSFFKSQSDFLKSRLTERGDNRAVPSHAPIVENPIKRNPILDMDPDERDEYLRREAAAQEEIEAKKSRTGPMYNKGGDQYWTEDMLKDLKGGGHRRR